MKTMPLYPSLRMIKQSQSSIEFMILVGFVLFAFTIFLAFIYEDISDNIIKSNNRELLDVAKIIKEEVDLAYKSSDGYQRVFKIPYKIGNLDYEINITEDLVYIKTENGKYSASIPVKRINYSGSSGLIKGDNIIEKINGEIFINRNG